MIHRIHTFFTGAPLISPDVMRDGETAIMLGYHMWQAFQLAGLRMYAEDCEPLTFAVHSLEVSETIVDQYFAVRSIIESSVLAVEKDWRKQNRDNYVIDQDALRYDTDNIIGEQSIYRNALYIGKYLNALGTMYLPQNTWRYRSRNTPSKQVPPKDLEHKHGYATEQLEFANIHKAKPQVVLDSPDAALSAGGLILSLWLHLDFPDIMHKIVAAWHEHHPERLNHQTARYAIKTSIMLLFARALRDVELPTNAPFAWCAPFLVTFMQDPAHVAAAWRDALSVVQTKYRKNTQWMWKW